VVSLPAGLVTLPPARFAAWTLLGSLLWCGLLVAAGYGLERQYDRIATWMNPVSTGIFVLVVVGYLVRVVRHGRAQ
jgi:membrane protein DedA with SNARE-associated domain